MRAVNLIPEDLRGATAGRTGNAVHVLLGALAVVVVLVSAWALTGRQVTDAQNELNRVRAEAAQAQAQAARVQPYKTFAELRAKRTNTVTELSRARFNWPYALREMSRVLPADVQLTKLDGTTKPPADATAAPAGTPSTTASAPSIALAGCTSNHRSVAEYLARLRGVDGVTKVTYGGSTKVIADASGEGAATSAAPAEAGACRRNTSFEATVLFENAAVATSATAAAPAPAGGAAPTTQTAAGGTK